MTDPGRVSELKPWENAFVGNRRLYTTIVFWQCTVALAWALISVWIVYRKLYPRYPSQFFLWSIVVLTIFIVYRTATFLRRSIRIRVILRQQLDKDEYEVSLRKAKALSGYYVLSMMGIGLLLDMLLFWVSS
jgi:hypothetical protein